MAASDRTGGAALCGIARASVRRTPSREGSRIRPMPSGRKRGSVVTLSTRCDISRKGKVRCDGQKEARGERRLTRERTQTRAALSGRVQASCVLTLELQRVVCEGRDRVSECRNVGLMTSRKSVRLLESD